MFTDPLVQILILIFAMNAIGAGGAFLNKRLSAPPLTGSVLSEVIQQGDQEDVIEVLKSIDAKLARLEQIEIYRFKKEYKADKGKVA